MADRFVVYKLDKRYRNNRAYITSHKLTLDGMHKGAFSLSSNLSEAIRFYKNDPTNNVIVKEHIKEFETGRFISADISY